MKINMNCDTLKISMELQNLDFDISKFAKVTTETNFNNRTDTMFTANRKKGIDLPIGLNNIVILPRTNVAEIEFSAKILKENYLLKDGINSNTLEQAYSVMQPFLTFSIDEMLDSDIRRVDFLNNLRFKSEAEKQSVIMSLKLGISNKKYEIKDYTKQKTGIWFKGKQSSFKVLQKYYSKYEELLKRENKEIMQYLKGQEEDIKKILRVEREVTSKRKIMAAIGKKYLVANRCKNSAYITGMMRGNRVTLRELLDTEENPIYKGHLDIYKYANKVTVFDEDADIKDLWWWFGAEGAYMRCNSSLELTESLIREKSRNPRTAYNYIKRNREYHARIRGADIYRLDNRYCDALELLASMLSA